MRLRYTGSVPVTFATAVGEVQPDAEFDVPDDQSEAYLGREDIAEVVQEDVPAPDESVPTAPRTRKTAKPDAADAAPSE